MSTEYLHSRGYFGPYHISMASDSPEEHLTAESSDTTLSRLKRRTTTATATALMVKVQFERLFDLLGFTTVEAQEETGRISAERCTEE